MVSAFLRGEKPTTNQSLVHIVLVYGREPKPTIDGPHITAGAPVTRSNSDRNAWPSARRRSSGTESRNSFTSSPVGRVLILTTSHFLTDASVGEGNLRGHQRLPVAISVFPRDPATRRP